MGSYILFLLLFSIETFPVYGQEIFFQGSRPYILIRSDIPPPNHPKYISRSGTLESSEEIQENDDDRIIIKNTTSPDYSSSQEIGTPSIKLPMSSLLPGKKQGNLNADPPSVEEQPPSEDSSSSSGFRFLWPFQVSITKTKGGHPGEHPHPPYPEHHQFGRFHHHHHGGHHHGHHHHQHHGHHHHQHHGHHHHEGYGHDHPHGLEYEKVKLKYEIYKLKAKSKIAILQNKIELKKILSLLLQQKIKALEWLSR